MTYILPAPIVSALRVAGPMFFLSMQASSVQTALKIQSDKTVGEMSSLPFVSLFTNCVIWTYYGMLRTDMTVLAPNIIGIAVGSYCVYIYQRYGIIPSKILYGSALVLGTSTLLALQANDQLLGLLGCIICVILMGSPLATLGTVIRSRSTASIPFLTSLSTWLNALCWMSYGLLVADDPMIYGPNGLGLALASLQLSLFLLYGFPRSEAIPSKTYENSYF